LHGRDAVSDLAVPGTTGTASAPAAVTRPSKPVMEIRGERARLSRDTFRELWAFREVLAAFAIRTVKVKYKQASVGIGWAVIQPVLAAVLFAVFLGHVAGVKGDGSPYLPFALAGMVIWTFFSTAASTAMESLVSDSALLRKVYFPREVLPLAFVLAAVVDLLPGLVILLIIALAYGIHPGLSLLALPLPLLIAFASATALGLGISGLNVYYRDVRYALPFVIQLGLFASPVVYSLRTIPDSWRTLYAVLNPLASAIDGMRAIFLRHEWPDITTSLAALGWALLLVALSYTLFKRIERGFSDRI
jgi:lipopolysaccharide transport system permease protein